MPFRLRKAPKKDAYWVVDDKGKHYSKNPMPKEAARRQQKALYAAEGRGEIKGRGKAEEEVAAELGITEDELPQLTEQEVSDLAALQDTYTLNKTITNKLAKETYKRKREGKPTAYRNLEELLLSGKVGYAPKKGKGQCFGRPRRVAPEPPQPYQRPIRRRESIERHPPAQQVRLGLRELVPAPIADEIVRMADPENRVELARINRRMAELEAQMPAFVGPQHLPIAREIQQLGQRRQQLQGRGMMDAFAYFGE